MGCQSFFQNGCHSGHALEAMYCHRIFCFWKEKCCQHTQEFREILWKCCSRCKDIKRSINSYTRDKKLIIVTGSSVEGQLLRSIRIMTIILMLSLEITRMIIAKICENDQVSHGSNCSLVYSLASSKFSKARLSKNVDGGDSGIQISLNKK